MVLKSKRPVSSASNARMRRIAEMRIKKQMSGTGIATEIAKIIGPIVLKEGVKIVSQLAQKKIRKKKGGALRPAGARPPARRSVAPLPRKPKRAGMGKKRRKKR